VKATALRKVVSKALGRLGLHSIKVGSHIIECEQPLTLAELEGFGDRIRPGDVVQTTVSNWDEQDTAPYRIEAILPHEEDFPEDDDAGFRVLARPFFDGPLYSKTCGSTSMRVNGDGWRRTFKKLSAKDVCDWFWSQPKLSDGWHILPGRYGEVEVKDGTPVRIRRSSQKGWHGYNIKLVAELAGRVTGTVIEIAPKYSDPEKLVREVVSCETMRMPKVY
jgi:hypothetical protein